jgi:hypothetical protein
MDNLRAYHYVLPIQFPVGPALEVFERIKNKPKVDSQSSGYLRYAKNPPDTYWIRSSMNFNRSALFHSGALHLSEPEFCDWVIDQLKQWIPGPTYREKVAFIQTPAFGINPHIDFGPYRKAGINIGLRNTDHYHLRYGRSSSIARDVFYKDAETFVLQDGQAHIINVGNPHAVDLNRPHPQPRLLLSYSFHETYERTLEQLGIEIPNV